MSFPNPITGTHTAVVGTMVCHGGVVSGTIQWSYNTAPTGGNLTVSDGTNTLINENTSLAGLNKTQFKYYPAADPRQTTTFSVTLTFTVADGGAAIVGSLEFIRD